MAAPAGSRGGGKRKPKFSPGAGGKFNPKAKLDTTQVRYAKKKAAPKGGRTRRK